MDPQLWELQQAAEQRVERMRQQSRRIAEQQGHRTAASLRAARPPLAAPPLSLETPPAPPVRRTPVLRPDRAEPAPMTGITAERPTAPDIAPAREPDAERRMLLLLTLLLARSGASADLLLILLYLAL